MSTIKQITEKWEAEGFANALTLEEVLESALTELDIANTVRRMELSAACQAQQRIAEEWEDRCRTLRMEIARVKAERDELQYWKESAISVSPPMQEIGREIGCVMGDSVHDRILPWIQVANSRLHQQEKLIKTISAQEPADVKQLRLDLANTRVQLSKFTEACALLTSQVAQQHPKPAKKSRPS